MFAMGTQTLPPGGRLGVRGFDVGEGMFFIYRGTGQVWVNHARRPVAPETLVYVGRGAPHDIENDGREDLCFAWVVTPPGLDGLARRIGVERTPGRPMPAPFDPPGDAQAAHRRARLTLLREEPASAESFPSLTPVPPHPEGITTVTSSLPGLRLAVTAAESAGGLAVRPSSSAARVFDPHSRSASSIIRRLSASTASLRVRAAGAGAAAAAIRSESWAGPSGRPSSANATPRSSSFSSSRTLPGQG